MDVKIKMVIIIIYSNNCSFTDNEFTKIFEKEFIKFTNAKKNSKLLIILLIIKDVLCVPLFNLITFFKGHYF